MALDLVHQCTGETKRDPQKEQLEDLQEKCHSTGKDAVQEAKDDRHYRAQVDQAGALASTSTDNCFEIAVGPRGRGLFATREIPPHSIVHVAPCLPVDPDEYAGHFQHTILEHYLFNARKNGRDKLLALGYGSLFNHATRPNIDYRVDRSKLQIVYWSGLHPIPAGEELCISYGTHQDLWFDNAEETTKDRLDDDHDSSTDEESADSIYDHYQDPVDFLGRMLVLEDNSIEDYNDDDEENGDQ